MMGRKISLPAGPRLILAVAVNRVGRLVTPEAVTETVYWPVTSPRVKVVEILPEPSVGPLVSERLWPTAATGVSLMVKVTVTLLTGLLQLSRNSTTNGWFKALLTFPV